MKSYTEPCFPDAETLREAVPPVRAGFEKEMKFLLRTLPEERKEKNVKYKITMSFALALLILFLTCATAFAITNWDALREYFEKVTDMGVAGELLRWSEEDQMKFFTAMHEAGLTDETDPRVQTALDESLPLADRAKAADEIIAERYGAGYFSSDLVENIEFPEDSRTEAENEVYYAWQAENWKRYDGRTPIPMEGARFYALIESDLTEIGEFPRELMRSVETEAHWDEERQCWLVLACMDKEEYVEGMRRFGGHVPVTIFDTEGWVEDGRIWFGEWYSADGEYRGRYQRYPEIGQEEAWEIAKKVARGQLHMTDEMMNSMDFDANKWDGDVYDLTLGRFRPVWYFGWSVGEEVKCWIRIDAYSGEVTEAVNADEGVLYSGASKGREGDADPGERRYGTPDTEAIPREKAVEIARAAIVERGERPGDAAGCSDIDCRYDVTDPGQPVWVVHFGLPFDGTDPAQYRLPTDPSDYTVTLDGRTGEVMNVEMSRTYIPYFY